MDPLKQLYFGLPVTRELREVREQLEEIRHEVKRIGDICYYLDRQANGACDQLTLALLSQDKYREPKSLNQYGFQAFSQNEEDGMIAEIFRRIGIESSYFVEIGVGDGLENNTSYLLLQNWQGCWIEGSPKDVASIRRNFQKQISGGILKVAQSFVKAENIVETIQSIGVPTAIDLLSIDIDQNTFWIWAALGKSGVFSPRVVTVEYNASIGPSVEWAVEYDPNRAWDGTVFFGASLKSFQRLGEELGYSLVGCDITGLNAFFVRNDLVADKFAAPYTSENHFLPPRYFLTRRQGHPLRT